MAGHIARLPVNKLRGEWASKQPLTVRILIASKVSSEIGSTRGLSRLMLGSEEKKSSGETSAAAFELDPQELQGCLEEMVQVTISDLESWRR